MSFVTKAVTAVIGIGLFGLLMRGKEPEKQRLGEISAQTAKEAEPRVIVWGRVRPIGGNIIHCQKPVKKWVKQKVEGGKGGSSKKEQKVENVFRTYALGVCEGPITGFVRIWRNNKLVYDARGNAWGAKNNPVFLKSFRLYTGAWSQLPSPELERIWGAGQVPAYRGTAYMVSIDENLTETDGMVPQWQFEVERAEGVFYTSKPYAVEDQNSAIGGIKVSRLRNPTQTSKSSERISGSISVSGLEFKEAINQVVELEQIESGISVEALSFRTQRYRYKNDPESTIGAIAAKGLVFRIGKIKYRDPAGHEALAGQISVKGLSHG